MTLGYFVSSLLFSALGLGSFALLAIGLRPPLLQTSLCSIPRWRPVTFHKLPQIRWLTYLTPVSCPLSLAYYAVYKSVKTKEGDLANWLSVLTPKI